ncbi:MAG: GIY-YIG nuclease family protein [Candidatus Omnitrophota bacterium]
MWYVYMVECENGKFYTGMTDDVERRFKEHGREGSHFTSYNHANKLLYKEEFDDKHAAARREKQIKGWTRRKKMALAAIEKRDNK